MRITSASQLSLLFLFLFPLVLLFFPLVLLFFPFISFSPPALPALPALLPSRSALLPVLSVLSPALPALTLALPLSCSNSRLALLLTLFVLTLPPPLPVHHSIALQSSSCQVLLGKINDMRMQLVVTDTDIDPIENTSDNNAATES
jgi:hypothetical protein